MTYKVSKDGDSYKISLRSPNSLRPTSQNGAQVGPVANVTSTNPKTPSPSTNDVSLKYIFVKLHEIQLF